MNPFKAIRLGLGKAKRRKRAMLLYWLFHTLLALIAAAPLAGVGIGLVAKTRYGDELLRDFDLMFLFEAVYRAGRVQWAAFGAVPLLLAVYIGAIYLAGGAFTVLRKTEEVYSPAMFWEGAGHYFWRFLRVSLYSVIAWMPFAIVGAVMKRTTDKIWGEGMAGGPLYVAGQVRSVVLLLLAAYAVTVVDFTRARLVEERSRRVFRTLLRTMQFVAGNLFLSMGPWALLGIAFAIISALYIKFANWIPTTLTVLVILVIVVQQAYVLARVWLRFVGWGAVIEIDAAARGEYHEPEQEVFSYVGGDGGDGSLRRGAAVEPEAEGPQAG
jgi:hypothetical protein